MSKIRPHASLKSIRADEVAECWNVSEDLYRALWGKIVPVQKPIPNIEDNGPADVVGIGSVSKYWRLLTDEEKIELNAVAKARDEEFKNWRKSLPESDGEPKAPEWSGFDSGEMDDNA